MEDESSPVENSEVDEEMSVEELANHVDDKFDVLLNLLIKKGVISEQEFDSEYDNLYEDVEE